MLHLGIPPDCNVSSSQMHSTEAIIPQVDAKVAAFDVGQGDDEAEANVVRVDVLQCAAFPVPARCGWGAGYAKIRHLCS